MIVRVLASLSNHPLTIARINFLGMQTARKNSAKIRRCRQRTGQNFFLANIFRGVEKMFGCKDETFSKMQTRVILRSF